MQTLNERRILTVYAFTRKLCGMTIAFIIALVIMSFGVAIALAQEMPKAKPLFAFGTCSFTKKGEMMKGGEVEKPCAFGMEKMWSYVLDRDGSVVEVIETDFATGKNKSVWKKGRET